MDRPDLRQTLIDTGVALLEAGAVDLSLRSVARHAGVSAMAPYRHFADKAALLTAVAARGFADLRARLMEADRADNPAAALVAQGMAYIDMALERPPVFRLMFSADPPEGAGDRNAGGCDISAFDVLANRVATIAGDDGGTAAIACWAIVHGLAVLTLDARIPPARAMRHAVLASHVAGLIGTAAGD